MEWDSNLRPSGCKALNLPLSHHAPTTGPPLLRRLHEAHTCISVMLLHVRAIGLSLTPHSRSYRRLLLLRVTTTSSCNTSLSGGRPGPQGGSRSRGPTPS